MASHIASFDIPKEPAVRRAWVSYQLRVRGLTVRQLALREGVSHQALGHALMMPSAAMELVLAKALGLTVEELFSERFDETGRRLYPVRGSQRTTGPGLRQRQKRGAA